MPACADGLSGGCGECVCDDNHLCSPMRSRRNISTEKTVLTLSRSGVSLCPNASGALDRRIDFEPILTDRFGGAHRGVGDLKAVRLRKLALCANAPSVVNSIAVQGRRRLLEPMR
jgi:hypothetical protein